jgi:hypothetical protein
MRERYRAVENNVTAVIELNFPFSSISTEFFSLPSDRTRTIHGQATEMA